MNFPKLQFLPAAWIHRGRQRGYLLSAALTLTFAILLLPTALYAQGTITVDTTADDTTITNLGCSLREAISSANTDSDVDGCTRTGTAPYTIDLPAGIHQLSIPGAVEDDNVSGDLDIRASLTISGAGAESTFVQAGLSAPLAIDRVLQITNTSTVTITGTTVRFGNTASADENGGGIAITGNSTLHLIESAVTNNSSQGDAPGEGGGGIFNDLNSTLMISNTMVTTNTATNGLGNGGGILNAGTLHVMGGAISGNGAARAGGGVESNGGIVSFTDIALDNNTTGINGGGLHISAAGVVTMTGGTASGNQAGMEGGALWNSVAGTLSVHNATLRNNSAAGDAADQGGGAIHNDGGTLMVHDSRIEGNSATGTSGSGGGILAVPGSAVTVNGGTITNNSASRAGGGIEVRATVTDVVSTNLISVTLASNSTGSNPGNGGALHITGPAMVTVTGGTVMSNTAAAEGGGLWNSVSGTLIVNNVTLEGNSAAGAAADQGGGALFNDGGKMVVTDSTIRNNMATGTSGSGGGILVVPGGTLEVSGGMIVGNSSNRAGGGIELKATVTDTVVMTVTNVSFMQNSTGSAPGNGGALHITGPAMATITGGTVMSNTAAAEGGGLWNSVSGTLMVNNVTLEGNSAAGDATDQGGGGLFNDGGTMVVTDSTIRNNMATGIAGSGGGILVVPGGTLEVSGGTIVGNSSNRAGGGIEINATVTDTVAITVTNVNLVQNSTGSAPGNGGGLHITGPGMAHFMGGMVSENSAAAEGGGLWNSIAGTLVVNGTMITRNEATGGDPDQGGGGIYNDGGTLTIMNATITDNSAGTGSGSGGGILAKGGIITVDGGMISNNMAMRAGGGIEVNGGTVTDTLPLTITLSNVNIMTNTTGSAPGNGGALHLTGPGTVNVVGGTVAGNIAAAEGGGLWNSALGTMSVASTHFEGNVANGGAADQGGGALYNDGGMLMVDGATIHNNRAAGTSGSGGGIFNNGGKLHVAASTLSGNMAMRAGGAIEDNAGEAATIEGSTLSENSAGANPGNGGALHITGAGMVTVTMSSVMSNTAAAEGGGLWNSAAGTLMVDKSTLAYNMASGGATDQGGGALYNDGGMLHVSNSTVSGNRVTSVGGGLLNQVGSAMITNVTFYENHADNGAGGIANSATITVVNSIIAHLNAMGADCSNVTVGDFNLDSDGSCGAAVSGSPLLGVLQNNGGSTMTHALLNGSAAIDAGNDAVCAAAPINNVDQRGASRPVGSSCDLGAFEGNMVPTLLKSYLPLIRYLFP